MPTVATLNDTVACRRRRTLATTPYATAVKLTWTAPGDDGTVGTATSYDVRYSTGVINAGNWGARR